jgi:hypothetical protein
MKKALLIIFIFTLMAALKVAAQPLSSQPLMIRGKVLGADSLQALADVHIINKKSGSGWISKADGTFIISASQHDTLVFSAIGFEQKEIAFSASLLDKHHVLRVQLTPKTYELDQVTVLPYPDYEQFKQDFVSLKLPPKQEIDIPGLDQLKGVPANGSLAPTITLGSPITAIYNNFSRSGRARRRSKVLEQTLTNNNLASARYNNEVVTKITGLQGEDLNEFMDFCTMPNAFILTATEYELYASINECYMAFLQSKNPSGKDTSAIK